MNKIFIIVALAISEHGSYPRHCTWHFFSAKRVWSAFVVLLGLRIENLIILHL